MLDLVTIEAVAGAAWLAPLLPIPALVFVCADRAKRWAGVLAAACLVVSVIGFYAFLHIARAM